VASANTAVGYQALYSFTTGPVGFEQIGACTAVGFQALGNATGGFGNSGFGYQALTNNTQGTGNTAIGFKALFDNTTGSNNTATGIGALASNTIGGDNSANGANALFSNTTGSDNTAIGHSALADNAIGNQNTAIGHLALKFNTGSFNTAIGDLALASNATGTSNTAVGAGALEFSTGIRNVALGTDAGSAVTTADNVICIGGGVAGENINNHTYIGNINTTTVSGGNADFVTVDLTTGLLGHLSSSRRYKEDIKPMDIASEALYQLKPVTYRYKKEIDRTQSLDYGLVAEEVAQIDPNLTLRGQNGQIESVRYTAVNAMLLNEFLKEHKAFIEEQRKVQQQDRKIEEQEATIAQLKHQMETVVARIKEHDSEIEKVNARIGISESVPQVVANEP
jgi:hypothetical protein